MATDRLVLDSSIALASCFSNEADPYADGVATCFPGVEAVVPELWFLETANAFLAAERQNRCTQADTARWTAFLGLLPILLEGTTAKRAWGDILQLARLQNLSPSNATYLELCLRRRLPLATLNTKLKAAATAAGVSLFTP